MSAITDLLKTVERNRSAIADALELHRNRPQIAKDVAEAFGNVGRNRSAIADVTEAFRDVERMRSQIPDVTEAFRDVERMRSQIPDVAEAFRDVEQICSELAVETQTLDTELRKNAVKNRRIATLEIRLQHSELEVESLVAEKDRKNSPVSSPDNRAWFLD